MTNISIESRAAKILRLNSSDQTNRLTHACVLELTALINRMAQDPKPLVITGNQHFFSAGADLNEIAVLRGSKAYEFALTGQALTDAIARFPAPVYAAVLGHCMGGGFDLALACHHRIAAPNAVFGHRGAALGLMTGWGGTQRLPRLIGKGRALELFVAAEKINASRAFQMGIVDAIADDPIAEVARCISRSSETSVAHRHGDK